MSRIVSLIVLAVLVVLFAVVFFQVMANFLVPMFIAVVLAVIFRPLHLWVVARCRGHDRVAAGVTTFFILVIVLVPILAVIFRAASDAVGMIQHQGLQIDKDSLTRLVGEINHRFGLTLDTVEVEKTIVGRINEWLLPVAAKTPGILGSFIIGLFVMVVSLYYFLADGPSMTRSALKLLPLEERYQIQLLEEFDEVSRAVVASTLLSALAQGVLAGIGYYFADFESVFLLMLLTMLLSMVPFVGAASVWASCAFWLFYFDQRTGAAIGLALYGLCIISMVDNIIKPLVLHGRSKLHPLLALLGVLGGVQALGPIGIFVGPMAVAFLQAGLNMLHVELTELDGGKPRRKRGIELPA